MTERAGVVQTVLGPIQPDTLGAVITHEHLLCDQIGPRSSPAETASDRAKWLEPVTLENYYDQRRHIAYYKENLQLLSVEDAVEEANLFRVNGGGCIVDVTPDGLARDPEGLARISRASGVHVVMGGGYYVYQYHPPDIASIGEEEIAEKFARDVTEGVGDTGIRSGIIGEIGLTWPVHPDEEKVLRSAVRASLDSGAPLTIHPGRNPEAPIEATRVVEKAGGDLSRTIVCHMDRTIFDLEGFVELAETGCYLEFDLFGWEESYYPNAPIDLPNDGTRVNYIIGLIEAGFAERVLVAHDIDVKVRYQKYGGEGRHHILYRIVPLMRRKGMSEDDIDRILVHNPARILTMA